MSARPPKIIELGESASLPPPHRVARALRERGARGVALLDSALETDGLGAFSFVTASPVATVVALPGRYLRIQTRNGASLRSKETDPLARLRVLIEREAPGGARELASRAGVPFAGGAVLLLSYDYGRRLERWPTSARPDRAPPPDLHASVFDSVIVWDHARGRVLLLGGFSRDGLSLEEAGAAFERAKALPEDPEPPAPLAKASLGRARSNFSPENYRRAVARVKRYIREGDVFQVNLSQRFEARPLVSADELYALLRALTPAPFMADLDLGSGRRVLSCSPERFLRLSREGRRAQAWPSVHHTVGVLEAELEPGLAWDALVRAAFPPASVTGAPKLRAIEIVDELEPVRRGIYTGALGWVGWDGALDLSVLIRTVYWEKGRALASAGGGIVLASDSESERQETLAKARAILRALSTPRARARGPGIH
ncbi:anthranilate synthase component I family protein [bacterium]|nr:anthranilate synthase component I family protein [bacterium]